ncbi:hypothetical protein ABT120_55855 [Nonomuraea angiospora]|uniref:hypothetical protein n=1 Tax=Nonomuraea angiospora TaxID=46172 RepID=UPI003327890F
MTADQPLICSTCQGVIVGAHDSAYTPARGRLIVTNGYCRGQCSDTSPELARDEPAESTASSSSDQPTPASLAP